MKREDVIGLGLGYLGVLLISIDMFLGQPVTKFIFSIMEGSIF